MDNEIEMRELPSSEMLGIWGIEVSTDKGDIQVVVDQDGQITVKINGTVNITPLY